MKDHLLLWIPRAAAVLVALFIGIFALDAFTGRSFLQAIPAFLIHLLPTFAMIAIIAIAWRRPLVGAIAFLLLAIAYAAMARRIDWILVVGGPLMLAALLYFAAWMRFRARPLP